MFSDHEFVFRLAFHTLECVLFIQILQFILEDFFSNELKITVKFRKL